MSILDFTLWKHADDKSPELMAALFADPNYIGLFQISSLLSQLEDALPANDGGRKVLCRLRSEVNSTKAIIRSLMADQLHEKAMQDADAKGNEHDTN